MVATHGHASMNITGHRDDGIGRCGYMVATHGHASMNITGHRDDGMWAMRIYGSDAWSCVDEHHRASG